MEASAISEGGAEALTLVVPDGPVTDACVTDGWPTVLLIHDGNAGFGRRQGSWLRAAGLAVAELSGVAAVAGDRAALTALEAAARKLSERPAVDAERLAVLGFGPAGTLAFLLACRSTRVAAAALVHGPVVYPQLDARRPSQPLELALNLGCPVFAAFGTADPALAEAQIDRMEAVLSQFAKPFDIVRLPGVGERFYDSAQPAYDAAAVSQVQQALTAFLQSNLEMQ